MSYLSGAFSLVSSYVYTPTPPPTLEENDFINIPENAFPEYADLNKTGKWLQNDKFVEKVFEKGKKLLLRDDPRCEVVSSVYNKIIAHRKIEINQVVILALEAQKNDHEELFDSCLMHLPSKKIIDEKSNTSEEMQMRYLLTKLIEYSIEISSPGENLLQVTLPQAIEKEGWNLIHALHRLTPVTHLQLGELTEKSDFNNLIAFVRLNPRILSLDLGKCPIIGDIELRELGIYLEVVRSLIIREAKISCIPRFMNFFLKEIECTGCSQFTSKLDDEFPDSVLLSGSAVTSILTHTKKKISLSYNPLLESADIMKALSVECLHCPDLREIYAEKALTFLCEGCENIETLYLPVVEDMSPDLTKFPKLKEFKAPQPILDKIIWPHKNVKVWATHLDSEGKVRSTEVVTGMCVIS